MDPYLAEIRLFGGNFAPRQWMLCQGQLLSVGQYDALFALLGTTYGGNGTTTFGLPDLRGRRAVHAGQGPGLSEYYLGQMSGVEKTTISLSQMPVHSHVIVGAVEITAELKYVNDDPDLPNPEGGSFAVSEDKIYQTPADTTLAPPTTNSNFSSMSLAATGGSQPIDILSPYQALNFIICVEGIFPSRN